MPPHPLHPPFFGVTGVTGVTALFYMDIFCVTGVASGVTGNTLIIQARPERRKMRRGEALPCLLNHGIFCWNLAFVL